MAPSTSSALFHRPSFSYPRRSARRISLTRFGSMARAILERRDRAVRVSELDLQDARADRDELARSPASPSPGVSSRWRRSDQRAVPVLLHLRRFGDLRMEWTVPIPRDDSAPPGLTERLDRRQRAAERLGKLDSSAANSPSGGASTGGRGAHRRRADEREALRDVMALWHRRGAVVHRGHQHLGRGGTGVIAGRRERQAGERDAIDRSAQRTKRREDRIPEGARAKRSHGLAQALGSRARSSGSSSWVSSATSDTCFGPRAASAAASSPRKIDLSPEHASESRPESRPLA